MNFEFDFSTPIIDKRDKGYKCDHCGLFVKRYTRTFNSNMAVALLVLYRNKDKGYVHLESLMSKQGYKRCGDASYLRHYKMIEPLSAERIDGSKRNGFYRITGFGILVAEDKATFKPQFLMFDNECEGFLGEEISIKKALGTKFSYMDLMSNSLMQNI